MVKIGRTEDEFIQSRFSSREHKTIVESSLRRIAKNGKEGKHYRSIS